MEYPKSKENTRNEIISSTTDPRDSSKKQGQPLSKNQFKIYNIMYNNFSYEQDVLFQKNFKGNFDMDKSTPSILSEQSFSNPNYFLNSVPVFKEIILYGDGNLFNGFLTQSEFFKILKKLRITNNLEIALNLLEKFDINKNNQISFQEFVLFFCKDILTLDFEEAFTPEIVFRLGVEIFRVIGKERTYLELRDLMNFLKENDSLDIDFIQLLEMFDFYDDIYSGTLKRKVNILSFFQNTGLKIAKAIDKKFLLYLKNLFKDLKLKNESVMKFIKVYEKSNEPLKKSSLELNFQKSELAKVFERNFNQIQNINEILIDNSPKEGSNLEKEIEEFFKENQPKNKGWLFRKNHEIGTHGQNLFFCLINNNTHLISLNPKTLKKALNISSIQIHKCNFLESIPSEIAANKGKKTVLKINKDNEGTSKKSFFIMDLSTLKTYLVRSDESLAILSVINFYISKSKTTAMGQNPNSLIQIIERAEPYYSGIIEFACCKKSSLNIFHSDLKNYSFKSKFIEIKANKLLISQYSLKDSLNLLEYELKLQNSPQESTQGYLFSLEKKLLPNNIPDLAYEENNLKSMKESFVVFNTLYDNIQNNEFRQRTENSPQNDANIDNFQNKKISFNNHTSEPHFQDLEVIYEKDECPNVKKNKNTTIRKSFKDFLNKLTGKKKKKVILAADSEFKRKEWVFSLNYYQTIILKDLIKKKNDTVGIRHTVLHESFQIKSAKTGKNFFKSSLVEKNTKNPDFYDVFSQQIIPNENGKNEINDMERNKILKIKEIPLKTLKKTNKPIRNTPMFFTEPDGTRNLESEDLLLTFTNLNADTVLIPNNQNMNLNPQIITGNNIHQKNNNENVVGSKYLFSQNNENSANWLNVPNKEIKTFKEEELWQKFMKFFLKTSHESTEMELSEVFPQKRAMCNESSSVMECENKSEDMPRVSPIFQCHYNTHK